MELPDRRPVAAMALGIYGSEATSVPSKQAVQMISGIFVGRKPHARISQANSRLGPRDSRSQPVRDFGAECKPLDGAGWSSQDAPADLADTIGGRIS
jgi:hypothetical protein